MFNNFQYQPVFSGVIQKFLPSTTPAGVGSHTQLPSYLADWYDREISTKQYNIKLV